MRADEKLTAFVELESAIRAFESGALDVSDKFRTRSYGLGDIASLEERAITSRYKYSRPS